MKSSFRKIVRFIASQGTTLAWIILFSLIILTSGTWYVVKSSIEESAEQRFNVRVNEIVYNIQKRMVAYKQVLLGGAALFASSDSVYRQDWYSYIKELKIEENYPGILGIGYSVVLNPSITDQFEKQIRNEGFPDFKVWPKSNDSIVTSIVYLEPFKGRNLRAFGFDMYSEETRQKALIEALEKGNASVTGKVKLVQETKENVQAGFIMYLPTYKKNTDLLTVTDRRKALTGFVYSPFRMNDLMDSIIEQQLSPGLYLRIYDGIHPDEAKLMYNSNSEIDYGYLKRNALFQIERPIYIEGHSWLVKFISMPSLESSIDYGRSNLIFVAGIIISLLLFGTLRSISENWELSQQFEQLLDSTGEGIYGLDLKGKCTFINASAAGMLGYTPAECLNKDMHHLIHYRKLDGTSYDIDSCAINESIKDGKERRIEDDIFWRADQTFFHVQYYANPIISHGEIKGAVVSFNDITERLNVQAAVKDLAERLQDTLESITDAFYTLDHDWKFTYINKEAERVLLRSRNSVLGKEIWKELPESKTTAFYPQFTKAYNENIAVDFEEYYAPLNKWLEVHAYPSKNGLTIIFRDITERKEAREKIEASLKEKDVLLREIHHRVKNNLQIIASLLNLQLQNLQDEQIIEILKESQNRIKSMALIHEKLYMAKNVSRINFDNYVRDLVRHLLRSYNSDSSRINFAMNIDEVNIDIDKTISLGLALNELVSNSLKHAFTNNANGSYEIAIDLKVFGNKATLIVKDNGKGFPDNINFRATSSLGLQLVNALIAQIDGSIDLEKSNGTVFKIEFSTEA